MSSYADNSAFSRHVAPVEKQKLVEDRTVIPRAKLRSILERASVAGRRVDGAHHAEALYMSTFSCIQNQLQLESLDRKTDRQASANALLAKQWRENSEIANKLSTTKSLVRREDTVMARILDRHGAWEANMIDTSGMGPLYR